MTNFIKLITEWECSAGDRLTVRQYSLHLPLRDAARIAALTEMYPRRSETELISELLTAALDELEAAMPYIPGKRVVSEDEEGNPVYEDTGPTPRFLELSRKYTYSEPA
jgi:hypothetical protein